MSLYFSCATRKDKTYVPSIRELKTIEKVFLTAVVVKVKLLYLNDPTEHRGRLPLMYMKRIYVEI